MNTSTRNNYRDHFFERGHWGIKVRQTLVALICWLILFTPIVITSATYLAYLTHGRHGHFFGITLKDFRN